MEDTLFDKLNDTHATSAHTQTSFEPLAARMRPNTLEEYVGQTQAVGKDSWLFRAIEHDMLSSIILYGPAGTGKTTLAHIIAETTKAHVVELSAISATVKDVRQEISLAKSRLYTRGQRTILFLDEIHRFSKSQQDALLEAVEMRTIILIGATTENPYFEVNAALISRSRIIELTRLSDTDIETLLLRALASEEGLCGCFSLTDDARQALILTSQGDARQALTTLELASQMATPKELVRLSPAELKSRLEKDESKVVLPISIDLFCVEQATPRTGLYYDKNQDMHYDVISAFIKSMRGSDADATLYWLARMIDAGEDPIFIARRILICASEDIGNADPQAICVASAAMHAAQTIGYPECRINLSQAALYLALAPKSNSCEAGIDAALKDVRQGHMREVPAYLRDRHRPGADAYGAYLYPHNYQAGWVSQRYLPDGLNEGAFYTPSPRGWEAWRIQQFHHNTSAPHPEDGSSLVQ